jgi:hypothetical protein
VRFSRPRSTPFWAKLELKVTVRLAPAVTVADGAFAQAGASVVCPPAPPADCPCFGFRLGRLGVGSAGDRPAVYYSTLASARDSYYEDGIGRPVPPEPAASGVSDLRGI